MERPLSDLFDEPADATPLAPDEREGLRRTYIAALRAADDHDLGPLVTFVRS